MLLDPQFLAEQILNSLQFSMLLFLLAIGLSVVFGLMDYLNLSHGTIYMFAAYVAFSLTHIGGSFWVALLLAPLVAAAVGVLLYFVLLKRAEKGGHLTQVLLTVGVIYMGTDLIRIVYGDLPKNVPQPEAVERRDQPVRHPLPVLSPFHHRARPCDHGRALFRPGTHAPRRAGARRRR